MRAPLPAMRLGPSTGFSLRRNPPQRRPSRLRPLTRAWCGHTVEAAFEQWLRSWVLMRHRGAEHTLLTAIAAGASAVQMAELMLIARPSAFADGGHLLDFVNKAFEALETDWLAACGGRASRHRRGTGAGTRCRGSDVWRCSIDLLSWLRRSGNCRRCRRKTHRRPGCWRDTSARRSGCWVSIRATS